MFLFEGIWIVALCIMKSIECFKHHLMGHTSKSILDNGADNDVKCRELAQDGPEKNFSRGMEKMKTQFTQQY